MEPRGNGVRPVQKQLPKFNQPGGGGVVSGRGAIQLGQFTNAITLLSTNRDQAGPLADEYHYWIGEAQFQTRDFTSAAETFVSLARDYPESPLRLRAAAAAAAAYARLSDWQRHDALLENPDGVFQRAAQLDPTNELVVNGWLSLENSKFQQRDFPGAAAVYERLTSQWQALNQVQQCESAYLFYRAKMELGDFAAALAAATNLVQIASSPANQDWLAAGWSAQGAALEQMDHLSEAIQAWQNNLTNAPEAQEWEAIWNIAELKIVQGQLTNAAETLTNFLARFPEAISADIARLTVGELHLKDYTAQPADDQPVVGGAGFSINFSACSPTVRSPARRFWIAAGASGWRETPPTAWPISKTPRSRRVCRRRIWPWRGSKWATRFWRKMISRTRSKITARCWTTSPNSPPWPGRSATARFIKACART